MKKTQANRTLGCFAKTSRNVIHHKKKNRDLLICPHLFKSQVVKKMIASKNERRL
jgi:hypothetical protein